MKHLAFTLAFIAILFNNLKAQPGATLKDSLAERIKQVEGDMLPAIAVEGDKPSTLAERMAFYKVHGMSVAVIQHYKLIWAKGYGYADDSVKRPVTTQTLFQAGSVSKSLNAIGVLKLVQDKKIDLYTDINNYLTSWKFPYDSISKNKKITIINLLSHTAGLSVHGFPGYEAGKPVPTITEVLSGHKPANTPPVVSLFEPGLKFQYSGGGIAISQLIVMDITKQPYDAYMYHSVLKPLGMKASTFTQPPVNKDAAELATAYWVNGKQVKGKYHTYPEQAAAGLWTNPTDLSKFVIATQLAYEGKSQKVLNRQLTTLMLTPYIGQSAALGTFIDDDGGVKYFQHQGSDVGFQTQYYGSLEGGNGVIVMVNSDDGRLMEELVNRVARVYNFKGLNNSKVYKMVPVADSILQRYTGVYEIEPGFDLSVNLEGHQLTGKAGREGKLNLYPESETKFFIKETPIEIEFIKNDKGEATKAMLYQNGVREIKKIK